MLFICIIIFMPMIQTISIADQQHHQFRGGLFNFFSDINQPQLTA
ncbi:unnamed protein product, partial [Rotaria magnacalcarata]